MIYSSTHSRSHPLHHESAHPLTHDLTLALASLCLRAVQVVGVWTMLDAIQVAFGPYASDEMLQHDLQPEGPRSTSLPYDRTTPLPGGRSPSASSYPPASRGPFPTHPPPPSHPPTHPHHTRASPSPSHSPKRTRFPSPLPPRPSHAPSDEPPPLPSDRRVEQLCLEDENSCVSYYSSASSACGSTDADLPFEPEELLVRCDPLPLLRLESFVKWNH